MRSNHKAQQRKVTETIISKNPKEQPERIDQETVTSKGREHELQEQPKETVTKENYSTIIKSVEIATINHCKESNKDNHSEEL